MTVLLTGGTGFIGSHCAEQLSGAGIQVRALVRPTSDTSLLETLPGVTLARGHMEDPDALRRAASGVRGVIHAAGLVKARRPEDFHLVNALGTKHLLEAVVEVAPELERFVLVSSLAAAGPSQDGQPRPRGTTPSPVTEYGRSKLAAEAFATEQAGRLPITVLRPPAVYGPRDREVFAFFKSVQLGVLPITGSPSSRLSTIYGPDCASACIAALDADVPSGSVYEIDDGEPRTLAGLIADIEAALGRRAWLRIPIPGPVLYAAAAATEAAGRVLGRPVMLTRDKTHELRAPHWVADSEPVRDAIGWSPSAGFTEGARRTATWYRNHGWL